MKYCQYFTSLWDIRFSNKKKEGILCSKNRRCIEEEYQIGNKQQNFAGIIANCSMTGEIEFSSAV